MHLDRRIATVAAQQQNLISSAQLRALGATEDEVRRRVRNWRLHPIHRGVFAVGTPSLPPLGRERAALLSVGPGTALHFGSSAALWGMLPFQPSAPVEVLTTTQRRSRPGIVVHRTSHLPATDVGLHRGFPLTSPARVVLDMARRLSAPALERLAAEAIAIDPAAKQELAHRGTAAVKALLHDGPRRTRSQNERALLRLIREAGLPVPQTNAMVAGEEVDAYWPRQRLVVEVDAYATHGDRIAFERDRRKAAALTAHGCTVVPITDTELERRPGRVVATLAQALARPA